MLRVNKEGYYIIDSLEKLAEWYAMTNEVKPIQPKVKTKKKQAKATNRKAMSNKTKSEQLKKKELS